MKLALYNAALLLFAPLLLLKKAIKFGRRGHRHEWDWSRWKAPQISPRTSPARAQRVVFVALSWGEVGILDALSTRLEAGVPNVEIMWSIRDRGAQELAKTRFPARQIVAMPFDFAIPTQNWLEAVAPDALVVVEKFWWPNLLHGAKKRGAKIILVNGRSRGRDKLRYRVMSGFQTWVLGAFDVLMFESDSQIERVRAVLPPGARAIATGNIKFSFDPPAPPPEAQTLEKWLGMRARVASGVLPLLIAGSTAPIDEKWALEAWQKVREITPCALLIAPRRIERAGEIAALFAAQGLVVSCRLAPVDEAEVLLLDTLGELAYSFGFGIAAYIGGAVEGRGHNIIEPLSHGLAVGYGSNRGDFEAAQRAAEEFGVGFRLQNPDDLAALWQRTLGSEEWRLEIAQNAARLLETQRGALELVAKGLAGALN